MTDLDTLSALGRDSIRVPVRELQHGDVLLPTLRAVLVAPVRSLATPAGKCELTLLRLHGRRRGDEQDVTWGARTIVTIYRHGAQND